MAIAEDVAACTWSSPGYESMIYGHGPGGYTTAETLVPPADVAFELCHLGDLENPSSTGGAWEFLRIGPWNTTGGKDWTSLFTTKYVHVC